MSKIYSFNCLVYFSLIKFSYFIVIQKKTIIGIKKETHKYLGRILIQYLIFTNIKQI